MKRVVRITNECNSLQNNPNLQIRKLITQKSGLWITNCYVYIAAFCYSEDKNGETSDYLRLYKIKRSKNQDINVIFLASGSSVTASVDVDGGLVYASETVCLGPEMRFSDLSSNSDHSNAICEIRKSTIKDILKSRLLV